MRRAPSLAAFRAHPEGQWLVGRGWMTFCASPTLWGFALHGRLDPEGASELVVALSIELLPETSPHRSVADTRALVGVDPAAFGVIHAYVRDRHEALARKVESLAALRAQGLEGAVVGGFFEVLPAPFPVATFTELGPALDSLGIREPAERHSIGRLLEAASGEISRGVSISERLRTVIERSPRATLAEAARALSMSPRTLQRQLGEAGTSMRRELAEARLRAALVRIRESDTPLTTIALETGFASLQHMGQAVRAATGASPTELRRSQR